MRGSLQAYQSVSHNTQVLSASPHRLITILLSAAIERILQAKLAMDQSNLALKGEKISKAISILTALQGCLSLEEGGDIAKNLEDLYEFMLQQLIVGHSELDVGRLLSVIELLQEIKTAWESIPEEYHYLTQ